MRALLACALLASALSAACTDPLVCGADTVVRDGQCVPESLVECGGGTRLDGGRCVPVSTLACGDGTVEKEGRCVPRAQLTCGPGTEERTGRCEVLDPLRRVTVPEGAEPNVPPGTPKRFDLPALGGAPAVLGGTVGPLSNGQPDFDGWVFTAKANQRVRLKAEAIGAPAVGVFVQPADAGRTFTRFAITLDSRGAGRELVVPLDGDWLVLVSDQSNLTQGLPMGSDAFTYTVDVELLPQPEPKALEPGTVAAGDVLAIEQHAFEVTDAAPLFDVSLEEAPEPGFPGQRAVWATGGGKLLLNASDTVEYGYLFPMEPVRLAFPAGRTLVTVDYVYSLAASAPYRLHVDPVPITDLATLPVPVDQRGALTVDGNDVYAVEAAGNTVLSVELVPWTGSQIAPLLELRNRQWELVASVRGTKLGQYVDPSRAGRYFVVAADRTFNATKTNLNYNLKASLSPVLPVGPVGTGETVSESGALQEQGVSLWYALYAGNDSHLSVKVKPSASLDARLAVWPTDLKAPIGQADAGGAGGEESLASLLTPSGGIVLAHVAGDSAGTFTLELSAAETTIAFEQEPNDSTGAANPLVLDDQYRAQVAGSLATSSEADYFLFNVSGAPLAVTAETSAGRLGGSMDSRVAILSASGSTLVSNDNYGGSQFSRATKELQPGAYFVRVQRWTGTAPWDGSDYLLTISGQPVAQP